MFAPSAAPRVFGLPPGVDFVRALADGLDARLPEGPEAVARVEIWVNTERARRALTDHYVTGRARLLPRIRVVTELAGDLVALSDLREPASALGRKLDLARLVGALLRAQPGLAAQSAAFDLADGLADLLDEMEGEGVNPTALGTLDAGEHAEHWQRSLAFLSILTDYIAVSAPTAGQGRMRAVALAYAAAWADRPPAHPILIAGSTGSRGPTRAFMAAVARLPQGAVILPGFDPDLSASVWGRLGSDDAGAADHPQHGFQRLAGTLGFDPTDVRPWHAVEPPAPARNRLVSLALRPAPVTDQWRTDGASLVPTLVEALEGVTWIEADAPRAEARTIAFALRDAAETGLRAALITPDRELARRVTAELARWSLRPDDSAGRPLALTPPGVLVSRLAALAEEPVTPEALLSLLKHPLTASTPGGRSPHLAQTGRLELELLRGGPPHLDWRMVRAFGAAHDAAEWTGWIEATLVPLAEAGGTLDLRTRRLRATAEALAAGVDGEPHALWDKEAGTQARLLLETLEAEAQDFGPVTAHEHRALLTTLLAGRDVPEDAVLTHAGISIWGTLEARVQTADLVILGGLNEGTWPRLPGPDPWLSRILRRRLGLPSPERVIGLSAHDFQQAMAAPRVILSRATRDAEAPTVASRWLLRLENLLTGLGPEAASALAASRARGREMLGRSAGLDRPEARVPAARRPAPKPPAKARPAELSVTQIETLVRDPYAIYARKVLALRRLDPLGRVPDAMARGSALHAALDAFVLATADDLPAEARRLFLDVTARTLAAEIPWPAMRILWTARLARSAAWFLETESDRRLRGTPLAREIRGTRAVEGLELPLNVTAKADRIDIGRDGYAIYDYKSGSVPSKKEAGAFHLQLPLEAAIAEAGGFPDLPPRRVAHIELIGIGQRRTLAELPDPGRTWARLVDLLRIYQDANTGYVARLRPRTLQYASDYDHLSRFGEWADGDVP